MIKDIIKYIIIGVILILSIIGFFTISFNYSISVDIVLFVFSIINLTMYIIDFNKSKRIYYSFVDLLFNIAFFLSLDCFTTYCMFYRVACGLLAIVLLFLWIFKNLYFNITKKSKDSKLFRILFLTLLISYFLYRLEFFVNHCYIFNINDIIETVIIGGIYRILNYLVCIYFYVLCLIFSIFIMYYILNTILHIKRNKK